jgi:hypothetical protein
MNLIFYFFYFFVIGVRLVGYLQCLDRKIIRHFDLNLNLDDLYEGCDYILQIICDFECVDSVDNCSINYFDDYILYSFLFHYF